MVAGRLKLYIGFTNYAPADSIFSSTSNLVFLFQPFIAATRLTSPIIWLLLYSCKQKAFSYHDVTESKHWDVVKQFDIAQDFLPGEQMPSEHIQFPGGSKPVRYRKREHKFNWDIILTKWGVCQTGQPQTSSSINRPNILTLCIN